ncbi:uncharacterized protein LOC142355423 [Convolutriloba macropyga]|uniref:uncharacterized protein LOC142355423 n=1 Tax=Convolutriloba macropyga TaxID=536237 RepID=UPI003F51CAE9
MSLSMSAARTLGPTTVRRTLQTARRSRRVPRACHHLGPRCDSDSKGDTEPCSLHRRNLLQLVASSVITADLAWPANTFAEDASASTLPKDYLKLAPKLVDAVLESLDVQDAGAGEFEVRKVADNAKPLVREFMSRWKDDRRVVGETSHDEITESIRILADFYLRNGQRTALPRATVDSVRGHLMTAKEALPEPEKKNFLGF